MTDEYDDDYDGLCPDKGYKSFGRGAQQIAVIASWSHGLVRKRKLGKEER